MKFMDWHAGNYTLKLQIWAISEFPDRLFAFVVYTMYKHCVIEEVNTETRQEWIVGAKVVNDTIGNAGKNWT